jgi:sigma-B regulation protein RsbU (phosphoserine phosphatase)
LTDLNRQLSDPEVDMENFATIAYGVLDKRTGDVNLALAGHPLPLIVRRRGEIEYLAPGALPVGMFPEVAYEAQLVRLHPGDRLILYSDGVTECQNSHGDAFGDARLQAVSAAYTSGHGAQRLTDALGAELREWRGASDFEDDISILTFEHPSPGGTRIEGGTTGEYR